MAKQHVLTVESLQERICCSLLGLFFLAVSILITIYACNNFEEDGFYNTFGFVIILLVLLALGLVGVGLFFYSWSVDFDDEDEEKKRRKK